jgi:ankyrin repeat protein
VTGLLVAGASAASGQKPAPDATGELRITATGACVVRIDGGTPAPLRPGESIKRELPAGSHRVDAESRLAGLQKSYPVDLAARQKLPVQVDLTPLARERLREKGVALDKPAFFASVRRSEPELVRLFLDGGIAPDEKDPDGWPPLVRAASLGHGDVVSILLEAGADRDDSSPQSRTALMWAALRGDPGVVRTLIDAGADLNKQDKVLKDTALMLAAAWGRREVVRELIQARPRQVDLNQTNRMGWSALMYAARYGQLEIAESLVKAGAKADLRDELLRTAGMLAKAEGHAAAATYLEGVERSRSR